MSRSAASAQRDVAVAERLGERWDRRHVLLRTVPCRAVEPISYNVRRSERARRVRVTVDAARGVEVVLPRRASEREAAAAISELRPWIERRMRELERARAAVAARGDRVPYLGLVLRDGRRSPAAAGSIAAAIELLVPAGPERAAALERWYRRAARDEIAPRLDRACAAAGQLVLEADDPRPADALGQLLALGGDELQLAAAARARAGARLRRLARGLPPRGDGSLAERSGRCSAGAARTTASTHGGCATTAPRSCFDPARCVRSQSFIERDAGPGVFADPFAAQPGWELVPWMIAEQTGPPIDPLGADAVMTFGGAMHADQEDAHGWLADEKQLLSELLDAARADARGLSRRAAAGRRPPARRPVGHLRPRSAGSTCEVTPDDGLRDPLIGPLAPRFTAFEWHSYEIAAAARARRARSVVQTVLQAYRVGDRAWGIQFHAEVSAQDADEVDPRARRATRMRSRSALDWRGAARADARVRSRRWNELGRGLCERFLIAADDGAG